MNILKKLEHSDLVVLYLNVQGGLGKRNKHMELCSMANLTKASIIVVTEHHKGADCDLDNKELLKAVKNDKSLALEGFWSASKQRQKGKGGGSHLLEKGT